MQYRAYSSTVLHYVIAKESLSLVYAVLLRGPTKCVAMGEVTIQPKSL